MGSNWPQTTGNLQKVLRGAVKEMVNWRDPFVGQLVSSFMFDIAQAPKNPIDGWTGLSVTLRQAATKGILPDQRNLLIICSPRLYLKMELDK